MNNKMYFCLFFREDREIPAANGDPCLEPATSSDPNKCLVYNYPSSSEQMVINTALPLISLDCFFCLELLSKLCFFTNLYFENTSHLKPSYGTSWTPIVANELSNYILLCYFTCLLYLPQHACNIATLYSGMWAKHFMSRNRYNKIIFFK